MKCGSSGDITAYVDKDARRMYKQTLPDWGRVCFFDQIYACLTGKIRYAVQ